MMHILRHILLILVTAVMTRFARATFILLLLLQSPASHCRQIVCRTVIAAAIVAMLVSSRAVQFLVDLRREEKEKKEMMIMKAKSSNVNGK